MAEATEAEAKTVRGEAVDDVRPPYANGHEPPTAAAGASPGNANVFERADLEAVLESLLLAAGSPVPVGKLVDALDGPDRAEVGHALDELARRLEHDGRGIRLVRVAGGYQLRSAPQHAAFVRRLLGGKPPRLSRPMLETLAIIAYRQPCTRPEIEAIRGVDCGAVIGSLLERRLVRMQGRKDAPGRPLLYGTTREFLEVFGLPDLQALPPLAALGGGADVLLGPEGARPAGAPANGSDASWTGEALAMEETDGGVDDADVEAGGVVFTVDAGAVVATQHNGTEGVTVAARGGATD